MPKDLASVWASVERNTGIGQEEWLTYFEPHRSLDHTALAKLALARIVESHEAGNPALANRSLQWWAQGVTALYEQHIGRRQEGQRCDGAYGASASKTVPGSMDEVADRWALFVQERLSEVEGIAWASEPRCTATDKWRYWRCELENGAPVSVNISARPSAAGAAKCGIAVEMRKLGSSDEATAFKNIWKAVLAEFAAWEEPGSIGTSDQ